MKYMDRDELAKLIKGDKIAGKDYAVIDVRDDDRVGGHIIGSINEPSSQFLMNVEDLVHKTEGIPIVIFHCALSQIRGPKAARMYEESRVIFLGAKDIPHEVYVLRGGFTEFQEKYKGDPKLVEEWDKEIWESIHK